MSYNNSIPDSSIRSQAPSVTHTVYTEDGREIIIATVPQAPSIESNVTYCGVCNPDEWQTTSVSCGYVDLGNGTTAPCSITETRTESTRRTLEVFGGLSGTGHAPPPPPPPPSHPGGPLRPGPAGPRPEVRLMTQEEVQANLQKFRELSVTERMRMGLGELQDDLNECDPDQYDCGSDSEGLSEIEREEALKERIFSPDYGAPKKQGPTGRPT